MPRKSNFILLVASVLATSAWAQSAPQPLNLTLPRDSVSSQTGAAPARSAEASSTAAVPAPAAGGQPSSANSAPPESHYGQPDCRRRRFSQPARGCRRLRQAGMRRRDLQAAAGAWQRGHGRGCRQPHQRQLSDRRCPAHEKTRQLRSPDRRPGPVHQCGPGEFQRPPRVALRSSQKMQTADQFSRRKMTE